MAAAPTLLLDAHARPRQSARLPHALGAVGIYFGVDQWRKSRETTRLLNRLIEVLREHGLASDKHAEIALGVRPGERLDATKEAIADAIAQLPEREKLAVVLYYYEELTQAEIATVLEVSPSTVSRVLAKAVLRLNARLVEANDSAD